MQLYPDSPLLGQKGDAGQILRWPEKDITGRPYSQREATLRTVAPLLFVVIPHGGFYEPIEVVMLSIPKPKGKRVDDDDEKGG